MFHFFFQNDMRQKAASAAFTYLVYNPDDKPMQKNLKYYLEMPEVDRNDVINYEAKVLQKKKKINEI